MKQMADVTNNNTAIRILQNLCEFKEYYYYIAGTITTGVKKTQYLLCNVADYYKIKQVTIAVDTAPTGADIIVDININDVTIFTTQANRPKITDGTLAGINGIPDITTIDPLQKLSIDVDQVGSSVAGANLNITIIFESK